MSALSRVLDTTLDSINIALRRRVQDLDFQGPVPKLCLAQ